MEIPMFIREFILSVLDKRGWIYSSYVKKNLTPEIELWLKTNSLSVRQVKYMIDNSLSEIPVCLTCGNPVHFELGKQFCSNTCYYLSEIPKQKYKETCKKKYGVESFSQTNKFKRKTRETSLKRYGVENYNQTKEATERKKQTCMKKYGTEFFVQTDEFKRKSKETCMEKYGHEFSSQSETVKEKTKQTNLERYGVECVLDLKEIQERIKETNLRKYGYKNVLYSKEIQEKIKLTNMEKYGCISPLKNPEVRKKIEETNLERYGCKKILDVKEIRKKIEQTNIERYGFISPSKNPEIKRKIEEKNLECYGYTYPLKNPSIYNQTIISKRIHEYDSFLIQLKNKGFILLSSYDDYINLNELVYKHSCGGIITSMSSSIQNLHCPVCSKKYGVSEKEKELVSYIKSIYNGTVIENDRSILKGKELDIYLPDKNLAIEFNGTYWHSDAVLKDRYYHQKKTLECKEQNIRLIHVYEYEWDNSRVKIEDLLKESLGIYNRIINGSETEVREISYFEYFPFLDLYHIQGSVNSSLRFGLYYKDELLSCIGFGKSRNKQDVLELHRYCIKSGVKVIDGLSKLLKHSKQNSFVYYVNLSHFTGEEYRKCGFIEEKITEPSYKWIKDSIILNRYSTQKHKLQNILESYNDILSEDENMLQNGYDKIYNAGNLKMRYENGTS